MNKLRILSRDERGFNLIELMIVIAIIGLLIGVGSIAWGAMVRSGNETAALQTIDRLRTYEAQFASKNRGKFAKFADLVTSGVLDKETYGTDVPVVNGYKFTIETTDPSKDAPASYTITAEPVQATGVTATGTRFFFTNSALSTIKANEGGPATAESNSV